MKIEDTILSLAIRRITSKINTRAVILFGSRARGDHLPWSDYDLLIIADFKNNYLERIDNILKLIEDIKAHIEPHPYTLSEARKCWRKVIQSY